MIIPIWARWLVVVGIFLAGIAFGWVKGDEHGTQKLIDYVGKQATETTRIAQARTVVVERVTTKWRTRVEQVFVRGDAIEKEASQHVTEDDNRGCIVPRGFVRIYDAAVAGDPDPGAPGVDERAPSGVPLSVVAETDAFNLKLGHAWRARAEACVEAYEAVRGVK